jgi:hypothetical protein
VVNFWVLFGNFIFKINGNAFYLLRVEGAKDGTRKFKAIPDLLLTLLPYL